MKVFTVSVGEQQHQTVQTRVRHLRDVGGTPADGLNGGRRKRLVLTLHIRLNKDKETTQVTSINLTADIRDSSDVHKGGGGKRGSRLP